MTTLQMQKKKKKTACTCKKKCVIFGKEEQGSKL